MTVKVDKCGVSDNNNNEFINKMNIDSVSVCLIIINILTIILLILTVVCRKTSISNKTA